MVRWYVVRSEPNRERLAVAHIQYRHKLPTFLPIYLERVASRQGRLSLRRSLMFPSYVFAQLEPEHWSTVYRLPGVADMLPVKRDPEPLPHGFIDELKARRRKADGAIMAEGLGSDGRQVYEPSDELQITSGAYAGMSAFFVSSSGDRVRALMSIFGHQFRVNLTHDQVKQAA